MILETVVFYALLLLITLIFSLPKKTLQSRFWASIPLCIIAIAITSTIFLRIFNDRPGMSLLAFSAVVFLFLTRMLFSHWSFLGVQLFASVTLSSLAYLFYASLQTFLTGLTLLAIVLSVFLLILETCALLLSLSFTFEICDVLSRRQDPLIAPPLTDQPWVAIQVPSYNEPIEVVQPTLEALAHLNYPNLIVQVVDNNTKDPAVWKPLEQLCQELGPRFKFVHLEDWPGFKAGALNESTKYLPEEVAIIGIVDADYIVHPQWLAETIGHFDDPTVAFVQTSQHYRDWQDNRYLRGLFYSFRYFFDVTLPARAHRNAIIFCGTMGLIRRSAFQEIGGWNPACITEDAEASLRLLGAGYRGVYDPTAYGEGLMPLDFDGLKKQRFRWALGGIQILKFHWRELIPLAPHRLKLTISQRLHYLLGSIQWFADSLTAFFTLLLLATALVTALHRQLPIRQLTGAVLVIPMAFAATGLTRALLAMRRACRASLADAFSALRVWFALSWVVSLACIRGLIQKRAVFLRTPKSKQGGSFLTALRASRAETLLTSLAVLGASAMLIRSWSYTTIILASLLIFEGFVYSNAPWASMAAEGIILTPARQAYARSPQNTGDRPKSGSFLLAPLTVSAAIALAVVLLTLSTPTSPSPFTSPQFDLPKVNNNLPALPLPTSSPPSPSPTPSPSSTPTDIPSSTPTPLSTPTPSASPSQTPTPAPSPTTVATPSPSPT